MKLQEMEEEEEDRQVRKKQRLAEVSWTITTF